MYKSNEEFGVRFVKTTGVSEEYKRCKSCRLAGKEKYQKNKKSILEKMKTAEYKTNRNKRLSSVENKNKKQAYSQLPERIEAATQYRSTDQYRLDVAERRQDPKSKEKRLKYFRRPEIKKRENERPSRKRSIEKRHKKVKDDPGLLLQERLRTSISNRLSGRLKDEPSSRLKKYTSFTSLDDMKEHFGANLKPGMTLDNYGSFWSIAHKIPVRWFDASNSEDVQRCNSKKNLGCDYVNSENPIGEKSNQEKAIELPTDEELLTMVACFPVSWNNNVPSKSIRDCVFKDVYGRSRA